MAGQQQQLEPNRQRATRQQKSDMQAGRTSGALSTVGGLLALIAFFLSWFLIIIPSSCGQSSTEVSAFSVLIRNSPLHMEDSWFLDVGWLIPLSACTLIILGIILSKRLPSFRLAIRHLITSLAGLLATIIFALVVVVPDKTIRLVLGFWLALLGFLLAVIASIVIAWGTYRLQEIQKSSLDFKRLNDLAGRYSAQGDYAKAEQLYDSALSICEQELGAMHPDRIRILDNLVEVYRAQSKYADAESLLLRVWGEKERQFGATHPYTATTINDLAELHRAQGKYAEAEPLYKEVLSIREQQWGADHVSTVTSLNDLATLYDVQGKYAEAEPLYRRVLSIREKQLGVDHLDTAASLHNLARLGGIQGKHEEAEALYKRAFSIYKQRLGVDHPQTRSVRADYAAFLRSLGRDGEI